MDVQLELNLEKDMDVCSRILALEAQYSAMHDSFGKVRRKLFAELGELKKRYAKLQEENEELKSQVMTMRHEKTQWSYKQNGYLFDLSEYQEAIC